MAEARKIPFEKAHESLRPDSVRANSSDDPAAARKKGIIDKYSQLAKETERPNKDGENSYLLPTSKVTIIHKECEMFRMSSSQLFDEKFVEETTKKYQRGGEMHYSVIDRVDSAQHLVGVLNKFLREAAAYRDSLQKYTNSQDPSLKDEELLKNFDAAVEEINGLTQAATKMWMGPSLTETEDAKNNQPLLPESQIFRDIGRRIKQLFFRNKPSAEPSETEKPENREGDKENGLKKLKSTVVEKMKIIDDTYLLPIFVFEYAYQKLENYFSESETANGEPKELALIFQDNAGNVADMLRADTRRIVQGIVTENELRKARENQISVLGIKQVVPPSPAVQKVYKN